MSVIENKTNSEHGPSLHPSVLVPINLRLVSCALVVSKKSATLVNCLNRTRPANIPLIVPKLAVEGGNSQRQQRIPDAQIWHDVYPNIERKPGNYGVVCNLRLIDEASDKCIRQKSNG